MRNHAVGLPAQTLDRRFGAGQFRQQPGQPCRKSSGEITDLRTASPGSAEPQLGVSDSRLKNIFPGGVTGEPKYDYGFDARLPAYYSPFIMANVREPQSRA